MIDRRSAIQGLGAVAAGLALPGASPAPPRKPARLKPGDTVGLIAPARFADDDVELAEINATLAGMGLVPKVGPHVLTRYGYLAGTDPDRAADINAFYADPEVRALFAVDGGWGCARLLPYLDWSVIRANPKLLIGFSDITALHLGFAARAGFPTIHGPNAANGWLERSWNSFWAMAFQGATPTFANPVTNATSDALTATPAPIQVIRAGKASGRLIGGNLSIVASLVGTPYFPDPEGAILFLEDAGEAEYRIDRMLTQLGLAGVLKKAAGIVFGQCSRCHIDVADYLGFTLDEVLRQHLAPLGTPAFAGAMIGHISNQYCMPSGARVEIDAAAGSIRVLEAVVA